MLLKRIVLALPLALGWTIYTAQPTPGNFLLGYVFSVVVMMATGLQGLSFNLRSAPRQLYYLAAYVVYMAFEVLGSGIQVARIILTPKLPIDPELTRISTQDQDRDSLISAISAHGITLTPGELVVEFEEGDEEGDIMIVHSLNVSESRESLRHDQTIRLKRIKGILGHD